MVFKNLCVLVLWLKVASALEVNNHSDRNRPSETALNTDTMNPNREVTSPLIWHAVHNRPGNHVGNWLDVGIRGNV